MTIAPELSAKDVAELRELLAKHEASGTWEYCNELRLKLHQHAPGLLALASKSLERQSRPDYAAAIAKELRERGCTYDNADGRDALVNAPTIQVISAVLSVAALAAFLPQQEYQAERDAEVRRLAIEECAKVADVRAFAARTRVRGARGPNERNRALAAEEMAREISQEISLLGHVALAQQPPAKEGV